MRRRGIPALLVAGAFCLFVLAQGTLAQSGARHFIARLSGANERPSANNSTGFGFTRAVVNDSETQITITSNWEGLGSNTTAAHTHCCADATATAAVLFDYQPPTGAPSGSVSRTFNITAQQLADLRAGRMYSNVHTTQFGGGELRGTLVPDVQPGDFNGDGLTDFAILRNVSGNLQWWIMNNGASSASQVVGWGFSTDIATPGDFDGDRKTDIAVFRRGTGNAATGFWVFQSSTSTARFIPFGITSDRPVVADYDGDGKTDAAIFRDASSAGGQSTFWWLASRGGLANQQIPVAWGTNGDVPLVGDFTGDGRADFVVQRSVSGGGVFYVHPSTGAADANTPTSIVQFGLGNDLPVPGDYDGDGIADIAVMRNQGGNFVWYIRPSTASSTYYGLTFGQATGSADLPTQGDYDGDGKTDPAVWRPSATGIFYALRSTNGQATGAAFGNGTTDTVANYGTLSRPEQVDQ